MSTNANGTKELEEHVRTALPPGCELTKLELEGPQVVLYLKNIRAFYQDENLITKIASKIRKKILLRCDTSLLQSPEQALPRIKGFIPPEAGITEVRFDPVFNEVVIEALKPGLVIGKGGSVLKQIILETGWSPRVMRTPTRPSEVVKAIRATLARNAEDRKKFLNNLGKKLMQPAGSADWIKITALGGFKEVGRSCLLLQTPKSNVIVDCGMNIDTSDTSKAYPYLSAMGLTLDQIDAMIVTHAHLDHSGFVPYLYAYGYEGPTYCTPPTRDLMVLLQQDCVNVMQSEGKGAPYSERDIKKMLTHVVTREYGEVTDITPDIRFTFHNAGHMLGSAQVHLHVGEGLHNLVISGDLKYGRTKLLDIADTRFPRIETLLMESTYGSHEEVKPRLEEGERRLMQFVREVIDRKGKVLIPVIASGRAQEVMLVLEEYMRDWNVPVYMDGMSLEASAIHTVYPEYLRKNVQRRILQNDSPFDKPMFRSAAGMDRKAICEGPEPCVILAPSGMLTGGPSVQFMRLLAGDPKNAIIFVGWQSALSLGRKLQNGAKELPILGEGAKLESLKINMQVYTADFFGGHSDWSQLLAYTRNLRPKPAKIFTMHGEEGRCEELSRTLSRMLRVETRAPMNLDTIRLR